MTTAQDIITAAIAKSLKNKPGTLATLGTELVGELSRLQRAIYALAPRINFTYFAGYTEVAAAAESGGPLQQGWPIPEGECCFRLEATTRTQAPTALADGKEIVLVPFDDRAAEAGKPAVYQLGQTYFSAGNALDPTGGEIRVFVSRRPEVLTALTDALDPQWPEAYNEILIDGVAMYLASKDGRADEVASLTTERSQWMQLLVAHLEHFQANERRRYANVRRFNAPTLIPLSSFGLPSQAG